MKSKTMYRILILTVFILLMSVGIYIGMDIFDKKEEKNVIASNTEKIQVYNEKEENYGIDEEKVMDVDVSYTDIYPDCGHSIESKEHEADTTMNSVKKSVENKDTGYKLIGETDGVLIYQKVHTGKCMNHFKVILEQGKVVVYRMGENGEFAIYQITEITYEMLREGIAEQLEKGIEVDDLEELLLLLEDIGS